MNSLTLPILITIAVVGIIAIVLVKLFYKDKEDSDLSDELPPLVTNHWEESFDNSQTSHDDLNDYGFVTRSWEEPMEKKPESNNGVASKVFQEPMHSKHQDIISNGYQKEDNYTPIESSINNNNYNSASVRFDGLKDDENDLKNDFGNEHKANYDNDSYSSTGTNKNNLNNIDNLTTNEKNINENIGFEDNTSFSIRNSDHSNQRDNDFVTKEYITPKKYYSNDTDYDSYENNNYEDHNYDKNENDYELDNTDYSDSYNDEYNKDIDSFSSNSSSKNHDENNSLNDIGGIDIGEQVFIGGKPQTIKVGNEIIFNYNGESYSSRILEIKHENIKVKYRAQEKWINFSDIRKIF